MLSAIVWKGPGVSIRINTCSLPQQSPENLIRLAPISTNTAINKSLRRSQYQESPGRPTSRHRDRDDNLRRETRPSGNLFRRLGRPNHQPRGDVEDVEQSTNERYSKSKGRSGSLARGNLDKAAPITGTSRQISQYDYSSKPGGNRVTRRAAKFGHKVEPPADPKSGALQHDTTLPDHRLSLSNDYFVSRNSRPLDLNDRYPPYKEMNVPLSIPYTTSASEFLYGTSVVTAALLSSRRKLYTLYIYGGENRETQDQDEMICKLASKRKVEVKRVRGEWLRLMDKMSTGRPHNGYILEASPLPRLPVSGLQRVERRQGAFHVILDHQSREDEAINGRITGINYKAGFQRYPFVLLLDGILDPGNLGAILRTAFFLGVDLVAMSNRSSAPLSPVALKASAGASESMPLAIVNQPSSFIDTCQKNRWKVYAASAPKPAKRSGVGISLTTSSLGCPVLDHPIILMLGGEGEGLHWNIHRKADFDVGIDGQRNGQGHVDSLNVSVASGLLCEAFLRRPAATQLIGMGKASESVHSEAEEERLF